MRHRLTIHRTHDEPPITLDFPAALDDDAMVDALRYKNFMVYDLDNPVYAILIHDPDGDGVYGVAVATHQIDYITLAPVPPPDLG